VQLDYAATVNLAQGATTEVALAYVSDDADRQWAYVAFSRHTQDVRIYVVAEPSWLERSRDVMHGRVADPEPHERLGRVATAISRDTKKELAADGIDGQVQSEIDRLADKRLILGQLSRREQRALYYLQQSLRATLMPAEPLYQEVPKPQAEPELFR
jgi:hypothetical protein